MAPRESLMKWLVKRFFNNTLFLFCEIKLKKDSHHIYQISNKVTKYFPKGNFIMSRTNSYYNAGPGIDVRSSLSGEFRSAAETVLTWHMTDNIINQLEELDPVLLHTFRGNQ